MFSRSSRASPPQQDTDDILLVTHLSPLASTPTRAYQHAAGLDIYPATVITINTGEQASVPTDIAISPPDGSYARIASRSGLARDQGIHVLAGVIDPDFRGNVHVLLLNLGTEQYTTSRDFPIAQIILERYVSPTTVVVNDLPPTLRDSRAFGSSSDIPRPIPEHQFPIIRIPITGAPHAGKTSIIRYFLDNPLQNYFTIVVAEGASHILNLLPRSACDDVTQPIESNLVQLLITSHQYKSECTAEQLASHASKVKPTLLLFDRTTREGEVFLSPALTHEEKHGTWQNILSQAGIQMDEQTLRPANMPPFDAIIHLISTAHSPSLPYDQFTPETQTRRPHSRTEAAATEDLLIRCYDVADNIRFFVPPCRTMQEKLAITTALIAGKLSGAFLSHNPR